MNGYPKVFNIESDPREERNIGALCEWVVGPALRVVEDYKASIRRYRTHRPRTSRVSDRSDWSADLSPWGGGNQETALIDLDQMSRHRRQ
jgi:hypothetical protein